MIDVERILSETFVNDLEIHEELRSTNDHALQLAPRCRQSPHLVISRRQLKGRGRGANQWWSAEGALTFSLIIQLDEKSVPRNRWPEFSLATGAGVCAAVEDQVRNGDVRLKWPNDVYLNQLKVCGVLVEVPPTDSGQLVIGVGLNVNNSLKGGPNEIRERAIAMVDVQGADLDLTGVLSAVLRGIAAEFEGIQAADPSRADRWRKRCLLTGRIVTLHDGARGVTGSCQGIEDDGALLLHTEAGPQRFYGGVITEFL